MGVNRLIILVFQSIFAGCDLINHNIFWEPERCSIKLRVTIIYCFFVYMSLNAVYRLGFIILKFAKV